LLSIVVAVGQFSAFTLFQREADFPLTQLVVFPAPGKVSGVGQFSAFTQSVNPAGLLLTLLPEQGASGRVSGVGQYKASFSSMWRSNVRRSDQQWLLHSVCHL